MMALLEETWSLVGRDKTVEVFKVCRWWFLPQFKQGKKPKEMSERWFYFKTSWFRID